MAIEAQKYYDLAKACVNDDFDGVKAVLEEFPNIDLNVGRNGTPLILTGSARIGKLLIDNKAKINYVFDNGGVKLTALDSANEELTKVNTSDEVKTMVKEYIVFLKDNEAKTYEEIELQGEKA